MTTISTFEVNKTDLTQNRWTKRDVSLSSGEALLEISPVAFTSNNITYAVTGEALGYWKFFPTDDAAWGVIPVWGFATVVDAGESGLTKGERLYGYFPSASHLVVMPGSVSERGFTDTTPHRADLPVIYNMYQRMSADPVYSESREERRSILFPLVGTSFGLYHWMKTSDALGAEKVLILSASSKTALGIGCLFAQDQDKKVSTIGMTSAGNKAMVEATGFYDEVLTYDDVDKLDAGAGHVILDMSGNGKLMGKIHQHLGDQMVHTAKVGATHKEDPTKAEGVIAERTKFFFMPSYAAEQMKATKGGFLKEMMMASHGIAEASERWMAVTKAKGQGEIENIFAQVRDGKVPPNEGAVWRF